LNQKVQQNVNRVGDECNQMRWPSRYQWRLLWLLYARVWKWDCRLCMHS